jgi:hypothetical protein
VCTKGTKGQVRHVQCMTVVVAVAVCVYVRTCTCIYERP